MARRNSFKAIRTTSRRQPQKARGKPLVLIGGGGHAIVVAEAARLLGYTIAGFLDDREDAAAAGAGLQWLGPCSHLQKNALGRTRSRAGLLLCIGDIGSRRRLIDAGPLLTERATTLVHPAAFVSPSAVLGRGVFVGPMAVVHARASIGDHGIVNTSSVVEHECRIGANAHIAPGAVVAGAVRVGEDVLVGLGSRVLPNVNLGERCVIGAGGVVVSDVAAGRVVKGVPAR